MNYKLCVVILNYNCLQDTFKCLTSLEKQTRKNFLIVVVDNGSKEDPAGITEKFPNVVLLRREYNGACAGGNNTGIEYALKRGCEQIVFLNNDTVVSESFVERMICAADAHPEFGILGPLVYWMDKPTEVQIEGCLYNKPGHNGFFKTMRVPVKISDPPHVEETDIVVGCCLMARSKVFEQVGLYDERFFFYCEESDMCLMAKEAGFKCGIIAEALVWHKGSVTVNIQPKDFEYYYNPRNMWLLLKKHAGRIKSSRGRVASMLQYMRTIHYYYCRAMEKGMKKLNYSLVDGVTDAWRGKFGIRGERGNVLLRVFVRLILFCGYSFYVVKTALKKRVPSIYA